MKLKKGMLVKVKDKTITRCINQEMEMMLGTIQKISDTSGANIVFIGQYAWYDVDLLPIVSEKIISKPVIFDPSELVN